MAAGALQSEIIWKASLNKKKYHFSTSDPYNINKKITVHGQIKTSEWDWEPSSRLSFLQLYWDIIWYVILTYIRQGIEKLSFNFIS